VTVVTEELRIALSGGTRMENMTQRVQDLVKRSGIGAGIVTIFIRHTTASVLIMEDEPGLHADTTAIWERLIPAEPRWQHNTRNPGEDNAHSHLRGQIQGQSLTVPFRDGALLLGTWQQIAVLDFDTRARTRELIVQIIGD
jgi:secondary thiamine-phosphate synthase enzyme